MRIGVRATASPPPPSQSRVQRKTATSTRRSRSRERRPSQERRPSKERRSSRDQHASKERRSSKDSRSTSSRRDADKTPTRLPSERTGAVRRLDEAIFTESDHELSDSEVQRELGIFHDNQIVAKSRTFHFSQTECGRSAHANRRAARESRNAPFSL